MKKIKNFKIKDCEDCFDYQKAKYLDYDFCPWHRDKEDQPPEIIKSIQQERKDLTKQRIILWIFTLVLGFGFFFLLFALPHSYQELKSGKECKHAFYSTIGSIAKCAIYLPILGWMICHQEKDAERKLKKLNLKKSEWIIEYEQNK